MLILSRRVRQRIAIQVPGYPDIWLEVTEINHNKVRFGIDAPPDVEIWREEVMPREEKQ